MPRISDYPFIVVPDLYPGWAFRFQSLTKSGLNQMRTARESRVADMGLENKTAKLPCHVIRVWRRDVSSMGPRINPRIKGAGGKPYLLKRKANTPNTTIRIISKG